MIQIHSMLAKVFILFVLGKIHLKKKRWPNGPRVAEQALHNTRRTPRPRQLNGTQLSFITLSTPALIRPWRVRISAVKKVYIFLFSFLFLKGPGLLILSVQHIFCFLHITETAVDTESVQTGGESSKGFFPLWRSKNRPLIPFPFRRTHK